MSTPRPDEPDPGLDVDAAFADIVAHWGPTPPVDEPDDRPPSARPDAEPSSATDADPPESLGRLFTPSWPTDDQRQSDLRPSDPWDEEEHFVPPAPPPVPRPATGRLLAWVGLLGTPAVALLLVVLHAAVPGWAALGLVATFVGGFAYLVATMSSEPPDPWTGDDGARL